MLSSFSPVAHSQWDLASQANDSMAWKDATRLWNKILSKDVKKVITEKSVALSLKLNWYEKCYEKGSLLIALSNSGISNQRLGLERPVDN